MKRAHFFPKTVGGFQLYKLFLLHISVFTLEGFLLPLQERLLVHVNETGPLTPENT